MSRVQIVGLELDLVPGAELGPEGAPPFGKNFQRRGAQAQKAEAELVPRGSAGDPVQVVATLVSQQALLARAMGRGPPAAPVGRALSRTGSRLTQQHPVARRLPLARQLRIRVVRRLAR
jgi:hypothetical protein